MFNKSGFNIYITRALVEVKEEERLPARDVEAKHVTIKSLDAMQTRFYKVIKLSDLLDIEARERLFKR
jgi:hypothetical protein